MRLEISPLWTPTSYGKEHISGYQIVAIRYIQMTDQVATYKTEREAIAARDRILRATLLKDDQAPS